LLYGGSVGIEAAANVSTILFDKTGTLTTGKLTVGSIRIARDWQNPRLEKLLWELIEIAETSSTHPAAKAMALRAQHELKKLQSEAVADKDIGYVLRLNKSTTLYGQGLICDIIVQEGPQIAKQNFNIAISTHSFVSAMAESTAEQQLVKSLVGEAGEENIVESHVLINGRWAFSSALYDQIRPESKDVIDMLKHAGYRIGMVRTRVALRISLIVSLRS
jgi:cation transport ATPase